MKCVSRKLGYFTEAEVQEALIRSHINFKQGALNYYLCADCSEYHLTSKGTDHPLLSDPGVVKRIKLERTEMDWQRKFRK